MLVEDFAFQRLVQKRFQKSSSTVGFGEVNHLVYVFKGSVSKVVELPGDADNLELGFVV